jgi:hypothetical protein
MRNHLYRILKGVSNGIFEGLYIVLISVVLHNGFCSSLIVLGIYNRYIIGIAVYIYKKYPQSDQRKNSLFQGAISRDESFLIRSVKM